MSKTPAREPTTKLLAWYTLAEFASMTGRPLRQIRGMAERGTLRTSKLGKVRVIYLTQLQAEEPDLWAAITHRLQIVGGASSAARCRTLPRGSADK
jgi:hypothetical protein